MLSQRLADLRPDEPVEAAAWWSNPESPEQGWETPILLRGFQEARPRASTYMARVQGTWCCVGWDKDVLNVDGVPHKVELMNLDLPAFRGYTLLSISELRFEINHKSGKQGQWLADGKNPVVREVNETAGLQGETLLQTAWSLEAILRGKAPASDNLQTVSPKDLKSKPPFVANVAERAEPFETSWPKVKFLPIFLSKFEKLPRGGEKAEGVQESLVKLSAKMDAHHVQNLAVQKTHHDTNLAAHKTTQAGVAGVDEKAGQALVDIGILKDFAV